MFVGPKNRRTTAGVNKTGGEVFTQINNNFKTNTMNKQQTEMYVDTRIYNMIYSKVEYYKKEIQYYFKHRHKGLGGIDKQQTFELTLKCIRDLRVWNKLNKLQSNDL